MSKNNENKEQLIQFAQSTFDLTREALRHVQEKNYEKLTSTLENRERAIHIMTSFHERVFLEQKNSNTPDADLAFNNQVNQLIERINSMDEVITSCLQHEKNKTQFEIAKTHKNKENFKGYNLNNTK